MFTASLLPQNGPVTDRDLPALLARMQQNLAENARLTMQYTSDMERRTWTSFAKDGKPGAQSSAKFENMFIEGLPYQRMVELNGKPLEGRDAMAENDKLDRATVERRSMPLEQKRRFFRSGFHSSLPVCCLATLFENRIVGSESINSRDCIVVESHAKPAAKPTTEEQRSSLDWKETTWIDIGDTMPVRIEAELLKDHAKFEKGMTVRADYIRVLDRAANAGSSPRAVWLQGSSVSHFRFRTAYNEGTGTTEQVWSNYKRFQVDMRLLEGSMEELPSNGNP